MKIPKITGVHTWGEVQIRQLESGEYDVFIHDFKFHAGEMESAGFDLQDVVEQILRQSALFLIEAAKSDRSDW